MISTVTVEALHSATYVEDYLDSVENLPDDVQRHLSRIREIDVQYRNYLRDVNAYYEQWSVNQPQNGTTTAAASGTDPSTVATTLVEPNNATKRAIARIQQSLIAAQELGDEKLQVVQQLQDLIDHRTRQLDQDFKNLGSDFFSRLDYGREDKMADPKEHSSSTPTSVSSPSNLHAVGQMFAVSGNGGHSTSSSPGGVTIGSSVGSNPGTGNSISHSISGNGAATGGTTYKSTGLGDTSQSNTNNTGNSSGNNNNAAGSNSNNTGGTVSGTSNNSNNNGSNNNNCTGGNSGNSNNTSGGANSAINQGTISNSGGNISSIIINNNNNSNNNNNNGSSGPNERSSKRARRTRNDTSGTANGSNTPCSTSAPMDVDPSDTETANVKQDGCIVGGNGSNGANGSGTSGSGSGNNGSGGSGTSGGGGNGNGGNCSGGNGSKAAGNSQANSVNPAGKKTAGSGKKKKRKAGGRGSASTREAREDTPPQEPIDPDEPTYCLCDQISFGEMILCDNDLCPIEWFHFSCVSLISKPKGKWFCPNCRGDRPNVMKPKAQFLKELERYNKEKEEKT